MDNFPDDVGWEKSLQLLKEAPPPGEENLSFQQAPGKARCDSRGKPVPSLEEM